MPSPHGSGGTPPRDLVYPKERVLYAVMVVVSLLIYAGLILGGMANPQVAGTIVFYTVLLSLLALYAHGLALGRIRGNAVRVSERQFPLLHRLATAHARRLGLKKAPSIYVMESGGLLNAFATRFLGRDFVVIYSDVLELALARGEAAVGFIVGHELGHIWRGHLKHRWLTTPARFVPYLGAAYSRACEYTCDRAGAHCQPEGAISGLLVLAAGKQLHAHVDVREYAGQAVSEQNFWVRRAELMSTHPNLPKRIAALIKAGIAIPAREQWAAPPTAVAA
jgi:Zn-dependent protease with chaperone function